MKIYWKAAYHSTHLFSLLLCLCTKFTAFSHRQRSWGVEDFLNDFQWLSHTSRYGTLPIKILIKKRSAVRSSFLLSIVLSAGFFFDPKEQLNDLLFTATYLDYCSIQNASDTRKNPSKWNRKENKAGANNKNHNYKYFLERLRGLLFRANISTISLMTVWKWC